MDLSHFNLVSSKVDFSHLGGALACECGSEGVDLEGEEDEEGIEDDGVDSSSSQRVDLGGEEDEEGIEDDGVDSSSSERVVGSEISKLGSVKCINIS